MWLLNEVIVLGRYICQLESFGVTGQTNLQDTTEDTLIVAV